MNPDANDLVDIALQNLGSAISELGQALDNAEASLEQRAHWLAALEPKRGSEHDGLYKQLAVVTAALKAQMARQMPYGQEVEVEGVGVLTYSSTGGSTKWNWSALKPVLAAQIADEVYAQAAADDGNVPPLAVVCERAINAFGDVVSLTPSKKGKTTALKARNLDPHDYVTTTDAEPSVRFL